MTATIRQKVEGILREDGSEIMGGVWYESRSCEQRLQNILEKRLTTLTDKILSLLPSIEEMAEVINAYINRHHNSYHVVADLDRKGLASALSEKFKGGSKNE